MADTPVTMSITSVHLDLTCSPMDSLFSFSWQMQGAPAKWPLATDPCSDGLIMVIVGLEVAETGATLWPIRPVHVRPCKGLNYLDGKRMMMCSGKTTFSLFIHGPQIDRHNVCLSIGYNKQRYIFWNYLQISISPKKKKKIGMFHWTMMNIDVCVYLFCVCMHVCVYVDCKKMA